MLMLMLMVMLLRCEIDVRSEGGCKKAENLFKALMLKISTVQDSLRAQPSYVLEQTLDFSTAFHQFKVTKTHVLPVLSR